ncbi:hypothetical protein BDV93DRAFT_518003 [Ceratobasidium sp. AG-I]|nr:hypothetical protein BDV93DRAFT_518003 [Ceratobasidium sp. AG-I]
MSTYSHHSSRRSHSSSRPVQYVTAAPSSHYSHRTTGVPVQYVSSRGSTRSHHSGHSGHNGYQTGSTGRYIYAQPARSTRSSGSVATVRERPRNERAKSSGVKMTVIPATPRRVSRGSVVSYRSETDKHGKVKFSTKLRRLFGLGPKREEIKPERGRTTEYVYPSGSSAHRRSTSRVVYT